MFLRMTGRACLAILAVLVFSCGGGGQPVLTGPAQPPAGARMPVPGNLPIPEASARHRSAFAEYELLLFEPVLTSGNGSAVHAMGEVTLDPALNDGLAWAVYALPGFPLDGSVTPVGITVDCGLTPVWVGYTNYLSNNWEFMEFATPDNRFIPEWTGLVSAEGVFYVTLIASAGAATVTRLAVNTDADLPGGPEAVVNLIGMAAAGMPATFTAEGSTGGDGAITAITYLFDGGNEYITADPLEQVTHTFATTGIHSVAITVDNDLFRSKDTQIGVSVGEPMRELLIIYNSDMPEDLDLVEYYSSSATGRAIDPAYRLGLPLTEDPSQTISRELYGSDIRDPILDFIDDDANTTLKANIKYLLLMKGVPHKIQGSGSQNDHDESNYSSVDSELCTLRSGGVTSGEGYPIEGHLWSATTYQSFSGSGFYKQNNVDFTPDSFMTTPNLSRFLNIPLNYLVGRLSAYTYETAKAMVDRSLAADTSGSGWIIWDTKAGSQYLETMFDPVWPEGLNGDDSGYELLTAAGFNVFGDETNDRITWDYAGLTPGVAENMLGYCSWGVHSGFASTYILNDLGWTYRPGACFMSYESFNGQTLRCTDPADPTVGHPGQGQIADFLHMGGTVASGNAWEPFTDGVGDERWVFDRYLHHGDRWIEAAYKGLPLLSWQEIVVGDPLCRVVAD